MSGEGGSFGCRRLVPYLGALVAVCALGVFTSTAVADVDSTPSSGTPQAVAASPSGGSAMGGSSALSDAANTAAASEGTPSSGDTAAWTPAVSNDSGSSATEGKSAATTTNEVSGTQNSGASEPPAGGHETSPGGTEQTTTAGGEQTSTTVDTSTTPACGPEGLVFGTGLTVGSTSATATFSVKSGCSGVLVTLASYKMPEVGVSFPQTLFATSSGVFSGGGPHTLTVALPTCFFQVDLIRGTAPGTLAGWGSLSGQGLLRAASGGTGTTCATSTPPTEQPPSGGTTPPSSGPPAVIPPETTTTTPTTTSGTAGTTTTTTTSTPASTPTNTTANVAGQGATKSNSNALGAVAAGASLPFTGRPLALVIAIAVALVLLGTALVVLGRRGRADRI